MMKTVINVIKKAWGRVLHFSLWLACCPVWAAIPTPPANDLPTGNQDWIDVGVAIGIRVIQGACIIVGGGLLIGTVSGMQKAWHTAHDKGDIMHFIRWLGVGVVGVVVGGALLYASTQIATPGTS